jgi:Ca-activated chloride channel family protein
VSFGSPIWLLALFAVPAAVAVHVWLERRRPTRASAWTSPALVPNLVTARPGWRRHVPVGLILAAVALLLVAAARPRATFAAKREEATVVLTIDVSGSMLAKDVKPSRLGAAEAAGIAFVEKLPAKFRVAVVSFGTRPAVVATPSAGRARAIEALRTLRTGEGTALGEAIQRSVQVARVATGGSSRPGSRPPAAVLLISDGAQTQGRVQPVAAAREARQQGVPVYTVSLGTQDGILERPVPGGYTERIAVPPDPQTLEQVAEASGGRFFRVASADRLKSVYKDLGSRFGKVQKVHELAVAFVGAGGVFALAGGALSLLWFRRLP